MANVGLFFYVKGHLFTEMVDIEHADLYGDNRIGRGSHYDIWEQRYEKIYRKPYDYYPRGRIVYRYKENKFILYIDKCIEDKGVKEIMNTFGLEIENTQVDKSDEHYICSKCNEFFLE